MQAVNPRDYYHEQDKQALDALRSIPGFTALLKAFMKIFDESMLHGVNMASKIRLSSGQLPEIYHLLPPICEVLGIAEPELYLEMNPAPNAYTFGDSQVSITLTSGLIEYMEEDELKVVIAHECGHIACHHVLYQTMASIVLNGGAELLGLGLLSAPLQLAFFYWNRCSEFSCDRAAAIYMGDSLPVVEMMIRLAGGKRELTDRVNTDLYLAQAKEYENFMDSSHWNNALQFVALMQSSHPFLSVRASEITKWCALDHFKKIIEFRSRTGNSCPFCHAAADSSWKFCKSCGNKI